MLIVNHRLDQAALPGECRPRPPGEALFIDSLMAATRREVAVLQADVFGAQPCLGQHEPDGGTRFGRRPSRRRIRDAIEGSAQLLMIIDPRPGLHIVDVNLPYAAATLIDRGRIVGEKLFDVFPDNPDLATADGIGNLFESLQRAAQAGRPDAMAVQRYDVQDTAGRFVVKHWKVTNFPILDDRGELRFLVHHALDVTLEPALIR